MRMPAAAALQPAEASAHGLVHSLTDAGHAQAISSLGPMGHPEEPMGSSEAITELSVVVDTMVE
jgi:hypothetical protein